MDEKDRILLHLLEENCRTPEKELAVLAEMSEEDVKDRIGRLEADGIIRRYGAVVDWERAGDGNVATVLELKVSPERDFGYDRIAERIARFVAEQIAPMDRIRETATHIIMKTYKENGTTFAEREEVERLPYSF